MTAVESRNNPPAIDRLSVFLPSNNVLYSYVLFGVIPSLYADRVDIRPSSRTRQTAVAVHQLLAEACAFAGAIYVVEEWLRYVLHRA